MSLELSNSAGVLSLVNGRQTRDNNVMHTKPDLRVFLKWMITRSGSVITDVMRLKRIDTSLIVQATCGPKLLGDLLNENNPFATER